MWVAILGWYGLVSVATFLAYGWDKRSSIRQRRRTPERTLHLMELCGGWPGAWAGQQVFRHKRRKREFMLVFWATVALHALLWAGWGWGRWHGWF